MSLVLKLTQGSKAVAAAGTAEPLVSSSTKVRWVEIQAKKVAADNTGNVFLGDSTLEQGVKEGLELSPGKVEAPGVVVAAIPSPFKQDRVIAQFDAWYPYARPVMVNPYLNRMICKDIGLDSPGHRHPLPTVGFTLLWNLYHIKRRMRWAVPVFVTGFTWHYDAAADTIQGVDIETDAKLPHTWNHFYPLEALWVAKHLYGRPGWEFSETASPVLERLKDATPVWGKPILDKLRPMSQQVGVVV